MANRQYGKGRRQASSRTARTVPVSRSPADSQSLAGGQSLAGSRGGIWTPSRPGTPAYIEPEVRRWPHPLEDGPASPDPAPEPALHYIRCALSYQNQLLADIKALLEQLAAAAPAAVPESASPAPSQEKG